MERSERLRGISDPVGLLEGIFMHAPVGFQIYTPDGHSLLTNQAFRDLFGSEPPPEYNLLEDEIAREQGMLELIHRAFRGETIHLPPVWYDPRELRQVKVQEGRRVAMESTFFPLFDRQGAVSHVAIVFKDVTAEHMAREQAEEAERRARLLSEAGAILVGSLDYVAALNEVARLVVPALADYCGIDVVDGTTFSRVAVIHADPLKQPLLDELKQRFPPREGSPQPAAVVVRSGQAELLRNIDDTVLAAHTYDSEHLALVRRLEMASHLAVPLQTRGQTVGALSMGRGPGREPFGLVEVELACELGRRMGSAIDLARLYQQAREAVRARDEFLSIASHELKTPLTTLQLQIEMLARLLGPTAERVTRAIEQSRRQTQRLAKLIESLLDVSRISVGRLTLDLEEVDLTHVTSEIVERSHEEAQRAGCALQLQLATPVVGRWDRLRLEQVISNLVSNALKYGAGRPVAISVEPLDGSARLTVRDAGIGISVDDQARIFERFERGVSNRNFGGFGLGLYIVRQLVEAHGGTISVESEPGSGSTFTVVLPRK